MLRIPLMQRPVCKLMRSNKRFVLRMCRAGLMVFFCLGQSILAAPLPQPAVLKSRLGPIQTIHVIEPNLSTPQHAVHVRYLGYPIAQVLNTLDLPVVLPLSANPEVRTPKEQAWARYFIEFTCSDGYVSRIPVGQFFRYQAYLVMAKQDGSAFQLSQASAQQNIALGPYYLVWDNLHSAALQKNAATYWPYQVTAIQIKPYQGPLQAAQLANQYCLSCHQVNGDGGAIHPMNLAGIGQAWSEQSFVKFVLNPQQFHPNSPMPALNPNLDAAQRHKIATTLYQYFNNIPRTSQH